MRALPIRLAVVILLLAICAFAGPNAEDPAIAPGGVLQAARRTPMGGSNSQITWKWLTLILTSLFSLLI